MKNFISRFVRLCTVAFLFSIATSAYADGRSNDWNTAIIDRVLASVQPGQELVQLGDMEVRVVDLQRWRESGTKAAFDGVAPLWTGGNVYYTFDASVNAAKQKAFLDGAAEWAMFANLRFIPRSAQANYITVKENPALGGGLSAVGMVGGQQLLQIGPSAWNRATIVHELGHALGMVHEHQRSDRDSFVTILTNNIAPGQEGNFVKLNNSRNYFAYDFLSVMHYGRNSFSVNPSTLDTMQPLAPYAQFINVMGTKFDPVLSLGDRRAMATNYGVGPVLTSVVTNTADSGPGTLRAALYYALDHPGTTITFNIPVADAGFSNSVFNILPTDELPSLVNATTLDGSTQPNNSNPNGPEILINGALAQPPSVYAAGIRFTGSNSVARGLIVNGFSDSAVLMDGSNTVGNTLSGCYLGVNSSGSAAVTNRLCPVTISGGARSNVIGSTVASARNVISGSYYQGIAIFGAGTRFNMVQGNYIGLNAAGTSPLPNRWAGVEIYGGAQSNLIGGLVPGARNIISGNGNQGVLINEANSSGNTVAGNFIGLNVISGNLSQGVGISDSGTRGNVITGNFIGVNPAGTAAIPNAWAGVDLFGGAQSNLIGGITRAARNVISGNGGQGVSLSDAGTRGNVVAGNFIGLNAAGTAAVSNAWSGVEMWGGPDGNVVGGTGLARNIISGNGNYGVAINGVATFGNRVYGNTIGLNATNGAAVPNAYSGVIVFDGSQSNQIGGIGFGLPNLISGNTFEGVQVFDAGTTNNPIRANSIVNNSGLGIFLSGGGNRNAAAPALSSATVTTNLTVSGTLSSLPSTTFQLDFYASPPPAAGAEGMTYLGTRAVTTSAGGSVSFTTNLNALISTGRVITATATDPAGNTSPFSSGLTVSLTSGVNDGVPNQWRALYFGGAGTTTNAQSCAACDPDGDGLNNFAEFLSGTNPTNNASRLRLIALQPGVSNNVASFLSVTGIIYRVEARESFSGANWFILADQVTGTGNSLLVNDPAASLEPQRFYRARTAW